MDFPDLSSADVRVPNGLKITHRNACLQPCFGEV